MVISRLVTTSWESITVKIDLRNSHHLIFLDQRLEQYKIKKEFHLRNTNWLGGKNSYLFLSYFLSAFFLMFVGGALLYILKGVTKENNESDNKK
jgi:hypothetical protein